MAIGRGRGWHGDPIGHAKAGRKGGLRSSKNRKLAAEFGEQIKSDEDQTERQEKDRRD